MEPARDQCAYYFAKDQIQNLQIRVTLEKLSGSQLLAASDRIIEGELITGTTSNELPLVSVSTVPDTHNTSHQHSSSHTQHITINWQQKLFSVRETVEYSRPIYADDTQYKDRYEQALKQKKRRRRKHRIFTHPHNDNYQFKNWQKASTSKKLEPDNLLRHRRNVKSSSSSSGGGGGITTQDNDNMTHTTHKITNNKNKNDDEVNIQYFYIMADLAPDENVGESGVYEVVLCELRYDTKQGQLTITPDFTKPATKPYRLESYGCDNALYEYKIDNISMCRTTQQTQHDQQLALQLARQHIEDVRKVSACEWDETTLRHDGEIRLVVMGEITRALNFDQAHYLYIHYTLYLPPGWRSNIDGECEGLTAACAVKYINDIPTTHYSTPFTFDITRLQSGVGWPVLLLGAFSIDWLGQDRDEGYATFSLIPKGDRDENDDDNNNVYTINTWRPAQISPLDKMRRFFLGGCQLITDTSYLAAPLSSQVNRVSRLGFNTVSSGSIEIRVNTLIHKHFNNIDITANMNNPSRWQPSTLAVIQAFNKSRLRLKAAKQGL